MDKPNFIEPSNVREDSQRTVMEQIATHGVCPFCMENFTRYHKQPILREDEHWVLTPSQWPYKNTQHHFMLVAKRHIESLDELSPAAMAELLEHFQWAVKEYEMPGGSFFMRFGNMRYNGSSVAHLHAQLLMGHEDAHGDEAVRVKLG
jgi:diadenosine tetraphosphate (Ap4A) HIT family hydrolase